MESASLLEADWIALEREAARRSLAEFAKLAWPILEPATELKWGWVLDAICEHLEAVTNGDILNLLATVPPGTMKSLLTSVIWPAWEWGPRDKQEMRFLGTAHAQNLALRDNLKCRRLIESEWFQNRWPVQLVLDQNAKSNFQNTRTGFREAMAFTSMTGSRGDRIIVDDPISADAANSDAELESARITFTETLPTRINNEKSAITVIMQRLNERDPAGVILDMGLDFEHLCVPMRFEEERPATKIGWKDPRTKPGELMFPERFPEAQVKQLEKTLGEYGAAGQLQQRPAPRGGGMFKIGEISVVTEVPSGLREVRAWDLAATADPRADWTAGVRLGETVDGHLVIMDVARGQMDPQDVRDLVRETAKSDGFGVQGSLPQDPGQAGKAQVADLIKHLSGLPYAASIESGNKETRAKPLAAQVNAGNVSMVKASWNEAFLDELEKFPAGRWDDQVDAASRAFMELTFGDPVFDTPVHQIVTDNRAIPGHWKKGYGIAAQDGDLYVVWVAEDPADTTLVLYAELIMRAAMPALQAQAIKARGKWIRGALAPRAMPSAEEAKQLMAAYTGLGLRLQVVQETQEAQRQAARSKLRMNLIKAFPSMEGLLGAYQTYRKRDGRVQDNPMMQAMLNAVTAFPRIGRIEPQPLIGATSRPVVDPMVGY